jgi:type VI secretion system protein ImpH
MADTDRHPPAALRQRPGVAELLSRPLELDFFAIMRRLQAENTDEPALGTSLRPSRESTRFAQEASLSFPPTSISTAKWNEKRQLLEVVLRFTGLLGPHGPLPAHLTEYVMDRKRHHDDPTIGAFLDLFHHRIFSLFFRAWAVSQPAVDYDRPDERRHSFYYRSLIGVGTVPPGERDSVPDISRLFFSGWLGGLSRSPDGLAGILSEFLGLPVSVSSFQGSWLELPKESRCRLGQSRSTGVLGSTCFAGERVWLSHLKFHLRLGPLSWKDYQRLLPGQTAFQQIKDWIRFYVGEEFSWEAQLVLRRDEFVPCQLGGGGRLGWTTWTGTPAPRRDLDDLILQSH